MNNQYIRRLEKIEAELNRRLPENPGLAWQTEVFSGGPGSLLERSAPSPKSGHLLQALAVPGRDLLSRGGKRWRPLLMTLTCEALGGGEAAIPLTPLVEFSHNASLIHDDIEDNSDERRGKPAVHIIHGVDMAINSGSFFYFLSAACIDSWAAGLPKKTSTAAKADLYSLWAAYMRRLHLGQAIDIYWHKNFDAIPTPEEYFSMCALKTGCLARFAVDVGIIAAQTVLTAMNGSSDYSNTPDIHSDHSNKNTHSPLPTPYSLLGEAAEKLGIGFQILDDVKNLTTGIPGKKRGDDIAEGKKSLPVLLYLQRRPEKKETVYRCFNVVRSGGVGVPETEELIQAFSEEGVLDDAEARGKALIAEAGEIFSSFEISKTDAAGEEGRALLAGFTDLLFGQ